MEMQLITLNSKLDFIFKNIFCDKGLLAIIMKETMQEYKNYDADTIMNKFIEDHIQTNVPLRRILGQNTEINLDNKQTRFDILFYARLPHSKDRIGIIINLEFQDNYYVGYPFLKRGHYYNARNISNQFETLIQDGNYSDLKKVVSIWFFFNPPKEKQNAINRYVMHEENILGNVHEKKEDYDMSEIIMVYLGSKDSLDDFINLMNQFKDVTSNLDKIEKLIEEKYHIKIKEETKKEMIKMFSYSEYVTQKGFEKGKEQGIKLGEKRGIELGEKLGEKRGIELGKESGQSLAIAKMIRNKMKKRHLSAEEAIRELDLDEFDLSYYLDLLEKYE